MSTLTPGKVRRIHRLRAFGYRINAIASALDIAPEAVDRVLWSKPSHAPKAESNVVKCREVTNPVEKRGRYRERLSAGHDPKTRKIVPAEVIAERDRALDAPRDLTARLLGDPPPSRSALAQKQDGIP